MTVQDELLQVANKLNYSWFVTTKKMFVAEKGYDPADGRVKYRWPNYYSGFDENGKWVQDDKVINDDIKKYCWEYDYEDLACTGCVPEEGVRFSMKFEEIIQYYVQDYISPEDDLKKHEFVKWAYDLVKARLQVFGKKAVDPEYSSVLEYFLVELRKRLLRSYGKYREKAQRVSKRDSALEQKSLRAREASIVRSFKWSGQEQDIKELYINMKKGFIAFETQLRDFKSVFLGKDISTIVPIRWHNNTATEVLYFIMKLSENELIAGKRLDYQALTGCFVKSDGKKFTANFKNLKQTVDIKLTQDTRARLDAIVDACR